MKSLDQRIIAKPVSHGSFASAMKPSPNPMWQTAADTVVSEAFPLRTLARATMGAAATRSTSLYNTLSHYTSVKKASRIEIALAYFMK